MHECQELIDLREEFNEYKDISGQIEKEMESQIEMMKTTEAELEDKVQKMTLRLETAQNETKILEQEIAKRGKELEELQEKYTKLKKNHVTLENENEVMSNNLREVECLLRQRDEENQRLQEEFIIEQLESSALREKLEELESKQKEPSSLKLETEEINHRFETGSSQKIVLETQDQSKIHQEGNDTAHHLPVGINKQMETIDLTLTALRKVCGPISSISDIVKYIDLSKVISASDDTITPGKKAWKKASFLVSTSKFKQEYRRVSQFLQDGFATAKLEEENSNVPVKPVPQEETSKEVANIKLDESKNHSNNNISEESESSKDSSSDEKIEKVKDQQNIDYLQVNKDEQTGFPKSHLSSKSSVSKSSYDPVDKKRKEKLSNEFHFRQKSKGLTPSYLTARPSQVIKSEKSQVKRKESTFPETKPFQSPCKTRFSQKFVDKINQEDQLIDNLLSNIAIQIKHTYNNDKKMSTTIQKAEQLISQVGQTTLKPEKNVGKKSAKASPSKWSSASSQIKALTRSPLRYNTMVSPPLSSNAKYGKSSLKT